VKRSTTSGSGYTTLASPVTPGYTDATTVNGTTYYYVVSAVNGGGESANSSQVSAVSTLLPSPWVSADIGAVGVAGSATYTNGLFTVKGSGADIWGAADAFCYVYQPASADCSVQVKVVSVQNTAPWAKAGVMIRETTNANSIYTMAFLSPVTATTTNGVAVQQRVSTGGTTSSIKSVPGLQAPYWVRLARTGNSFVGSCSADGINWTGLTTNTITMATNVYIGLPVCSVVKTVLNTATLTNVTAVP
jgi:regulation of enolase protein 1 (concanavalin A-like superfamily)